MCPLLNVAGYELLGVHVDDSRLAPKRVDVVGYADGLSRLVEPVVEPLIVRQAL